MNRLTRNLLGALTSVASLTLITGNVGCHRQFYRKQADQEVNCLVDEKARDVARPPNTSLRIDVDRRSRMYNPFDLDFQPMPLDDPASYKYMQCVDGRRGYPLWEAAGLTNTAENPDWWQFLPLDEDGVLEMNSENAVQIALLHSPDYQRQLESLYLAALDVSAQRFQFDTQFFGGLGSFLTADGRRRGGGRSSTRYAFGPNNLTMNRAFATGGDLVVNLANSIVWELSGPNTQSATTILDFSLIQPLLRGAGRDVVMEGLTQSERDLLAQVRAFERFRRSFFLRVTTGRGLEISQGGIVSINAGFIGGAGGYLGLLQTELQIRNLEENIARQTENLLLTENNLIELLTKIPDSSAEIIRERLQVAQARQRLLSSESSLVNQQVNYKRRLDAFMRDLGLPPYICARLNDPILSQFELIDRQLLNRRQELGSVRTSVGSINVAILGFGETVTDPVTGLPEKRVAWTPELREMLVALKNELQPLSEFNRALLEDDLPLVVADIEDFEESLPLRKEQNTELAELYDSERGRICSLVGVNAIDETIFDLDEVDALSDELRTLYSKLGERLQGYQSRIAELDETLQRLTTEGPVDEDPVTLAKDLRKDVILFSQDLLANIGDDVLAIQLIQARSRTESLLLPEVDIDPSDAFEIARKNRRDWANARAALVDAWRQIEVVADDLESNLDVVFSGDVGNASNNPFDLRSSTGRLRVGMQWDAPITRVLERNAYRRTLIQYEQTKRRYYEFEDDIWQLVRAEIRQLQANRFNFELGRQAVRIAASQIELNGDIRALNEARGQATGPTAARDAIDALNDLLGAQNALLDIFVNYEVTRRALDFDMGTMELTPEGLWIDPGKITPESMLLLPGTTLEGMIECGCNNCGLKYNPLPPEPYFGADVMGVLHSEKIPMLPEGEVLELAPLGSDDASELVPGLPEGSLPDDSGTVSPGDRLPGDPLLPPPPAPGLPPGQLQPDSLQLEPLPVPNSTTL